jgi:Rieske Fe-S protein
MSCTGCTRRTILGGLGLVLLGCGSSGDQRPVDAMPADAEPPVPCEDGKVCIDVSRASSGTLAELGGSHRVSVPGDLLIIVRTTETEFVVLSAVCTHEGCGVRHTAGTTVVRCPCHGSMFDFEGAVVRGPAEAPLRVYESSFDAATSILTITL